MTDFVTQENLQGGRLDKTAPPIGALVTVDSSLPGIFMGMLPGDRAWLLVLEMLNASDAGSFMFEFGGETIERTARCQAAIAFPSVGSGIVTLSERSSFRSLLITTVRQDTAGAFYCLYDMVTQAMEQDEDASDFLRQLIVSTNVAKTEDEEWCCGRGEDIEEYMRYASVVSDPVTARSIAADLTLPFPIRLSVLPLVDDRTLVRGLVSQFLALPRAADQRRMLHRSAVLLISFLVKLGDEAALAHIAKSYTATSFVQTFGNPGRPGVQEMLRALRL